MKFYFIVVMGLVAIVTIAFAICNVEELNKNLFSKTIYLNREKKVESFRATVFGIVMLFEI